MSESGNPLLVEVPPQPWLTSSSVALPMVTKLFLISSENFPKMFLSVTTEKNSALLSLLAEEF